MTKEFTGILRSINQQVGKMEATTGIPQSFVSMIKKRKKLNKIKISPYRCSHNKNAPLAIAVKCNGSNIKHSEIPVYSISQGLKVENNNTIGFSASEESNKKLSPKNRNSLLRKKAPMVTGIQLTSLLNKPDEAYAAMLGMKTEPDSKETIHPESAIKKTDNAGYYEKLNKDIPLESSDLSMESGAQDNQLSFKLSNLQDTSANEDINLSSNTFKLTYWQNSSANEDSNVSSDTFKLTYWRNSSVNEDSKLSSDTFKLSDFKDLSADEDSYLSSDTFKGTVLQDYFMNEDSNLSSDTFILKDWQNSSVHEDINLSSDTFKLTALQDSANEDSNHSSDTFKLTDLQDSSVDNDTNLSSDTFKLTVLQDSSADEDRNPYQTHLS